MKDQIIPRAERNHRVDVFFSGDLFNSDLFGDPFGDPFGGDSFLW